VRLLALCLWVSSSFAWAADPAPWAAFDVPLVGEADPIGSYANGCLVGGEAVPLVGRGYTVVRANRNRFYGHPELVSFIGDMGNRVADAKLGMMLVADIAMPRGGPFASGHQSHQTGLDADIWLPLAYSLKKVQQGGEGLLSVSLVDRKAFKVNHYWQSKHANLIRLAAEDERVARIFVHPAIKQALCIREWEDRSWLNRIRPWGGHDSHFHVRLHCPEGALDCTAQNPPPPGDGCGSELKAWWPKKPDPNAPPAKPRLPKPPKILPTQCQQMAVTP